MTRVLRRPLRSASLWYWIDVLLPFDAVQPAGHPLCVEEGLRVLAQPGSPRGQQT